MQGRGHDHNFYVLFSGSNYSDLTQKLCAILGPTCVKTPFPFTNDVCKTVTDCPFVSGKQYNDTMVIYVDPSFPPVSEDVNISIIRHASAVINYN